MLKAVSGGVAIVNAPLVHIGGVYRVLQCVAEARPFVLLPRFELATWVAAVRRYRPKAVSLVPAALRAVEHHRDRLEAVQCEERYHTLFERSPMAIGIGRAGGVRFVNPACVRLFGRDDLSEMVGALWVDFLTPECREEARRMLAAAVARGDTTVSL